MKIAKLIIIPILCGLAQSGWGSIPKTPPVEWTLSSPHIPAHYSPSSETSTLEWGCPVSEVVLADNGAQAVEKIQTECMSEVRRAAIEKPGVFDVISVSIIWPDIQITPDDNGFKLQGTFFLETIVMHEKKETSHAQ